MKSQGKAKDVESQLDTAEEIMQLIKYLETFDEQVSDDPSLTV